MKRAMLALALICAVLAACPVLVVSCAREVGLLVRKDCMHLETNQERIDCGKHPRLEEYR